LSTGGVSASFEEVNGFIHALLLVRFDETWDVAIEQVGVKLENASFEIALDALKQALPGDQRVQELTLKP
jgi:hypothetical protein